MRSISAYSLMNMIHINFHLISFGCTRTSHYSLMRNCGLKYSLTHSFIHLFIHCSKHKSSTYLWSSGHWDTLDDDTNVWMWQSVLSMLSSYSKYTSQHISIRTCARKSIIATQQYHSTSILVYIYTTIHVVGRNLYIYCNLQQKSKKTTFAERFVGPPWTSPAWSPPTRFK